MCVQLLLFGGEVVCSNKTSVCMYIYIYDKCVFAMTVSANVSASNQTQFLEKKEEGVCFWCVVMVFSLFYFAR